MHVSKDILELLLITHLTVLASRKCNDPKKTKSECHWKFGIYMHTEKNN